MQPVWRQIQRQNFTSLIPLLAFLQLPADAFVQKPRFPLNVPRRLAEKIEKGNLYDPILRQFLPLAEEMIEAPRFTSQPVEDETFRKSPKVLQKYRRRALFLATGACAMHCRYCFRQNFPYEAGADPAALEALRQDPTLSEVILSGGDPLSLGNRALGELLQELTDIPHVKRIRFHSRFPIGIPERIDAEFLSLLDGCSKQIYFIVHVNHPRELDEDVCAALKAIQKLGIPVMNQAVLLKGVNDDESTLLTLCEKLADQGIIPYYLHALDPVQGAAHFAVPDERGVELIDFVQANTSGYAVPKFVREVPGASSKTAILPESALQRS
jgi:EF-P beta-lysylation protein EpmB